MSSITIGVVGEGHRDQMAVEAVSNTLASFSTSPITVKHRRLQPRYKDATRRGMTGGGDDMVRQWCQISPRDRHRSAFEQPFPDDDISPDCDVLIIVHDADRLEVLNEKAKMDLPPLPWTAEVRATYVRAVLEAWLWPNGQSDKNAFRGRDYVIAPAVQALEAWYVAALDINATNPEEIDPVAPLIALRPDLENTKKPGTLLKFRVDEIYAQMNAALSGKIADVAARCTIFSQLATAIEERMADAISGASAQGAQQPKNGNAENTEPPVAG